MSVRSLPPRPLIPPPAASSSPEEAAWKQASPPPPPGEPPPADIEVGAEKPPAEMLERARTLRMRLQHDPATSLLQHRVQQPAAESQPRLSDNASGSTSVSSIPHSLDFERERIQNVVDKVLREATYRDEWSATDGLCLDLAAKWQERFLQEGIAAKITTVDPNRRTREFPVAPGMEGKFHAFLVVDKANIDPIVIDASWRQFIADAAKEPDLPEVFVGSLSELKDTLKRYENRLQIEIVDDPLLGRRKAMDVVELSYGAGAHRRLREVHEILTR